MREDTTAIKPKCALCGLTIEEDETIAITIDRKKNIQTTCHATCEIAEYERLIREKMEEEKEVSG